MGVISDPDFYSLLFAPFALTVNSDLYCAVPFSGNNTLLGYGSNFFI